MVTSQGDRDQNIFVIVRYNWPTIEANTSIYNLVLVILKPCLVLSYILIPCSSFLKHIASFSAELWHYFVAEFSG
ncbi:hypothetical protein RIF29_23603 [Crotalaria pallida]|uniref:Uncharacterized protein n=1 Tax=Crotalaria pallida TaxID=3830 RepID=A0AAN9F7Y8_CROPI